MLFETPKAPGLASKARKRATFVRNWPPFDVIEAKNVQNETQKQPKIEQISLQGPKWPPKNPSKNGDAFQPLFTALREGQVRSDHV